MIVLRNTLIAGCAAVALSPVAHAEKFFGGSSVTILHSADYQAFGGEEYEATYFTFENVTAHDWGSTFFFIDRDQPQGDERNGDDEVYGEFALNLSLGWLTGQDLSFGPVKDVTLAAQYEFGGSTEVNNYLTGFGLVWDVPGFNYLTSSVYYVNNSESSDE